MSLIDPNKMLSLICLFCFAPLLINGYINNLPFEFIESGLKGMPKFAEDNLIQPIVLERHGEDKDGNQFYEKEVIIDSQNVPKFGHLVSLGDEELDEKPYEDDYFEIPAVKKSAREDDYDEKNKHNRDEFMPSDDELVDGRVNLIENILESIVDVGPQRSRGPAIYFDAENNQPEPIEKLFVIVPERKERISKLWRSNLGGNFPLELDPVEPAMRQQIKLSDIFHSMIPFGVNEPNFRFKSVAIHSRPQEQERNLPADSQAIEAESDMAMVNDQGQKVVSEQKLETLTKIKQNLDNEQEQFLASLQRNNIEKKSSANDGSELDSLMLNNDQYEFVDNSYVNIELDKKINKTDAAVFISSLSAAINIPLIWFENITNDENVIVFKLRNDTEQDIDLNLLVKNILKHQPQLLEETGFNILACNRGNVVVSESRLLKIDSKSKYFFLVTIIACASILSVLIALISIFVIRRRVYLRRKLVNDISSSKGGFDDEEQLVKDDEAKSKRCFLSSIWPFSKAGSKNEKNEKDMSPNQDYEGLCRQRMQTKGSQITPMNSSMPTDMNTPSTVGLHSTPIRINSNNSEGKSSTDSSRSSTSSWSEEPINPINMDITTGHVILTYMEEHLNDKNRLDKEWEDLCEYEADENKTDIGTLPQNMTKNRYSNILPYDHNRVKLASEKENENDYINSSLIIDHDPKHPAYVATQGPLVHTTSDFWQMVWEQNSLIIVSLCRTVEYGSLKCNQYWPVNGTETYDKFEVNLVSEHVWCEDFLVRSFFLKNLDTNQTRTVTQFHYLTWPENGIPPSNKSILDFRRKVNKSYNSKSCPIVVHCNDGVGRTGTYILIDMILNKIVKGAKEIDLAATLEYLRDQRIGMVNNKTQFEFSFSVITEEVQNMLRALSTQ